MRRIVGVGVVGDGIVVIIIIIIIGVGCVVVWSSICGERVKVGLSNDVIVGVHPLVEALGVDEEFEREEFGGGVGALVEVGLDGLVEQGVVAVGEARAVQQEVGAELAHGPRDGGFDLGAVVADDDKVGLGSVVDQVGAVDLDDAPEDIAVVGGE